MHLWGPFFFHPVTYPVSNEIARLMGMTMLLIAAAYGAVLQPTIEDFEFLFKVLD